MIGLDIRVVLHVQFLVSRLARFSKSNRLKQHLILSETERIYNISQSTSSDSRKNILNNLPVMMHNGKWKQSEIAKKKTAAG